MLRFAYDTINWGTTPDLAAMFVEIGDAGWGAVELFDHSLDWLGPHTRLAELLGEIRVATAFGSIDVPANSQQLTVHKRRIDYFSLLGADAYGLVGGARPRSRRPTDAEYSDLARSCEELAVYGIELGVTVAYHPHVRCTIETEDEIDRLLAETKALTLCLDASHIALVGEDPIAHIRKYRDRLGYLHLKDWGRGDFVELGRGTIGIDFPGILRGLEELRFDGWIVVEQSMSAAPAESARINATYLQNLGYRLR